MYIWLLIALMAALVIWFVWTEWKADRRKHDSGN